MASKRKFSLGMLVQRLLVSSVLVFATYNPTGYSVSYWMLQPDDGPLALKAIVLLASALIYYTVIRIVLGAFRLAGLVLASLLAMLASIEIVAHALHADSPTPAVTYWVMAQYALLTASVLIMAFGMSWSYLIERLTGQLQKRYVQ
jgi:hypothetical protein